MIETPIFDQMMRDMVAERLYPGRHVVAGGKSPEWMDLTRPALVFDLEVKDKSAWTVLASRFDPCDDRFVRQTFQSQGGLLSDTEIQSHAEYVEEERARRAEAAQKETDAIDSGMVCGGQHCWCSEKAAETTEVLEGEVIDGSKPWVIGQDIPTEVVEEFEERGYAVDTEPAPVDQGNPSAHDLVIADQNYDETIRDLVNADLVERKAHGLDVYGVTLQGGNGRDQMRDAYSEALDLVCYLRASLFEKEEWEVRMAYNESLGILRALRKILFTRDGR